MGELLFMSEASKHYEASKEGIRHAVVASGALRRLLCRPAYALERLELVLRALQVTAGPAIGKERSDPQVLGALLDTREVLLEQAAANKE
jgi:hypothetical protein